MSFSDRWRSLYDPDKCGEIENILRAIEDLQRKPKFADKRRRSPLFGIDYSDAIHE